MAKKVSSSSGRARPSSSNAHPSSPASSTTTGNSEPPEHRWTFLTNHAHVLIVLSENPQMVLRQVALRVGITERAVQRIVQDLEEGGYLVKDREGRQNRYSVLADKPLRHPIEAHRNIGDLLELIQTHR